MNFNALFLSRWAWLLLLTLGAVALGAVTVQTTGFSRLLILGAALTAGAVLTSRWKRETAEVPRAKLVSRLTLSSRNQVCLIEVDARSFLVVHGERHAQVVELDARPSFAQVKERTS
ncbi:MAG: hypothetical protein K1X64_13685 [Myxococcaceae bacterium]|nr:hypothetical protein [Myxococcaceae bacterium]